MDTVKWILQREGAEAFSRADLTAAIMHGRFKLVRVLYKAGVRLDTGSQPFVVLVPSDVAHTHREELTFLEKNRIIQVTINDFPPTIEAWCREHWTYIFTKDNNLFRAIHDGELEAARWIWSNSSLKRSKYWHQTAARYGQLAVLKWLYELYPAGVDDTCIIIVAAACGHLYILKWLRRVRPEDWPGEVMSYAAANGNLEVVKWLHASLPELQSAGVIEVTAICGHLDVVQWLQEHRNEPCEGRLMDEAAKNGHLHVVKWLHANRNEGCITELSSAYEPP